jgi:hypothetical protein
MRLAPFMAREGETPRIEWVDPSHADVVVDDLRVQRGKVAVYVNDADGSYELVQPQPDYPPDPPEASPKETAA